MTCELIICSLRTCFFAHTHRHWQPSELTTKRDYRHYRCPRLFDPDQAAMCRDRYVADLHGTYRWYGWLRVFDFENVGQIVNTLDSNGPQSDTASGTGLRAELIVFAVIAAFVWPVIAVLVVGGYGFLLWMSQLILGPPGPPGT